MDTILRKFPQTPLIVSAIKNRAQNPPYSVGFCVDNFYCFIKVCGGGLNTKKRRRLRGRPMLERSAVRCALHGAHTTNSKIPMSSARAEYSLTIEMMTPELPRAPERAERAERAIRALARSALLLCHERLSTYAQSYPQPLC